MYTYESTLVAYLCINEHLIVASAELVVEVDDLAGVDARLLLPMILATVGAWHWAARVGHVVHVRQVVVHTPLIDIVDRLVLAAVEEERAPVGVRVDAAAVEFGLHPVDLHCLELVRASLVVLLERLHEIEAHLVVEIVAVARRGQAPDAERQQDDEHEENAA